jgi:hypothetical protein
VSVNARFCTIVALFGFVMVKLRVLVAVFGMVTSLNDLLMVGGPMISMVAVLLGFPGPLSFEETGCVMFETDPGLPVA